MEEKDMLKELNKGDTVWLYFKGRGTASNARAKELQEKNPTAIVEKKGRKYVYCLPKNGYSAEKFERSSHAEDMYGSCLFSGERSAYEVEVFAFITEEDMRNAIRRVRLIEYLRRHLDPLHGTFHPSDCPIEDVQKACELLGLKEG